MDWSTQKSSGPVTHPNNQQYLPQTTSSTAPTMPSHTALVQPNSYTAAQTFVSNSGGNNHILKGLLRASSADELSKIQMSALTKAPVQQTTQASLVQYNSSFNPQQNTTTATNQQSNCNVQSPMLSNYTMQMYPNFVLQGFQQAQILPVAQQVQQAQVVQQSPSMLNVQQQVQPMPSVQQPQPMTSIQQQAQSMSVVQQQAQPVPSVQQQVQQSRPMSTVQQIQPMPSVQQLVQQSLPMSIVQRQAQSLPSIQVQLGQQSLPMSAVQQQAQPLQQPQQMPNVQQQCQPMVVVQQLAQLVQQSCPISVAQQQAKPVRRYNAAGYNTRESQQSLQSSGYSHKRSSQRLRDIAKRCDQKVQKNYQTMQQPNAQATYSAPPSNSGQNDASYNTLNDTNNPISSSNYQNGQNIHNQMGSNFQTNALQPQQDMNDYAQSPQRLMMPSLHSGFASNSSATFGQMPLLYSQSSINASNQRLSNPNQNFLGPNVQQPVQSYTAAQDQQSGTLPPPPYVSPPKDQRAQVQDILAFLKVYRNVKIKYLLLNRANNLLRQKIQSSTQDGSSAAKPPLISMLNDTTSTIEHMDGEEVSQNSTVQSQLLSNTGHGIQTSTLYGNFLTAPVQNVTHTSNSFPSHVYPTNSSDVLNQRNYTAQMSLGSSASSSGQDLTSETLIDQIPQISLVATEDNQNLSSGKTSNANLPQETLHVHSIESLAQTTPAPESSNPLSNLHATQALTFSSREAIQASLLLWKSVSQNSDQIGSLEPRKPMVDNLNNCLEEFVSSPINEPTTVTLTQKSEHCGLNVPKGIEPQIAIVPPLVQIKGLVNESSPKVVPQSEVKNGVNEFKESDCFNKLLLSLESVDAAVAMNNQEDIQLKSGIFSSSTCSIELSSSCNVDQTATENTKAADGLQISGICTLVEGNSFYDSNVAMIFKGSLESQPCTPMAKTDLKYEHSQQCSQENIYICDALQTTSSVSPTTELAAVKSEPQGEIEPPVSIEDQQEANICLETQPENNLPSPDLIDLESNTVSDQLSELLTEFPFGIKNYMSKNEPKSTARSFGTFTGKAEIPKTSVPFLCEHSGFIKHLQTECAVDTSTIKMESPRTEDIDQPCMVARVPTPELPTDEGTSTQLDDCFEICDSPDGNILVTLLNPDQINKIFPEESSEPIVNSEKSVSENFVKESRARVEDVAVSPINEKSDTERASPPDRKLFCCLFGWLTHINGNAPKCSCKLTDLSKTKDLTNRFSQPAAVITTEQSAVVSSRDGSEPSTGGLKPSFSDPCKTALETEYAEFLPPVLKCPKLEPIDTGLENKQDQYIVNCSPQEEMQAKDLSKKYLESQSQKGLNKNDTLPNEKILQLKSQRDPDGKKSKDPLLGKESNHGHKKLEKLIIKTDFLKNKHLFKVKRKYKEIKASHVEEGGAKNVQKINSTEVDESAKTNMDFISGGKAYSEKNKISVNTVQSERSMNKMKLSSSTDKSHSHSQASLHKHRGRKKSHPESHFEKVMNLPTAQEYLKRKRELCDKRSGSRVDQRDEPAEIRHKVVEKSSIERNSYLTKLLRPLSPSKMKTKTIESESNIQSYRDRPRSSGTRESLHKKHRGPSSSHGKGSLVNKGFDQISMSSKQKIYLSPCDDTRQPSYEGISITKLQIRCSPEKPEYYERRKSLDGSLQSKQSKFETKNREAPKMLEFKLCPEFVQTPTTSERKGELNPAKERNIVKGIKSKKEAWCSAGPGKKSWMNSSIEDQGHHSASLSTSSLKLSQKDSSRPLQDSQATFNAFKQRYHEQRSKSLDNGL